MDKKPFIIAEVGSNWHTLEDCIKSIAVAKQVGADAVKFQYFSYFDLYGNKEAPAHYDKKYELPIEWIPKLREKADTENIVFLCTAFSSDKIRDIDPYVNAHKLASSDMQCFEMLNALSSARKTVYMSCGASTIGEVKAAMTYLDNCKVIPMYCVSAYPATNVDLFIIDTMRKELGCDVGYSDHTNSGHYIPVSACINHGAIVLEKHFSAISDRATPDGPHSSSPEEFMSIVSHIRGSRTSLLFPTAEERAMLSRHRRRLVATQRISRGAILSYGKNYGAFRAQEASFASISPLLWKEVDLRVAKSDIEVGQSITFNDI